MIEPFVKATSILEKIEAAGFEAYFVGGSVRDYLMNNPIADVDIATSALPEEIKEIFPKTVDVGIEHGTVLVLYKGESYEITTFRSEGKYEDFRRPTDVTFIRSLKEDLQRRDFTMNAIAMTKDGKLIDPFSGSIDIQNKLIRTVGQADERFKEDALRMMRAIRFVSKLSFQLEERTMQSLQKYGQLLEHIAVERKQMEFSKLLIGANRQEALHLLVELQLHQYLPRLKKYSLELKQVANIPALTTLDVFEMWSIILITIHKEEIELFLREWKLPVKDIRKIKAICSAYYYRMENEWDIQALYHIGKEICIHAEKIHTIIKKGSIAENIAHIEKLYDALPIKDRKELVISGQHLLEWENNTSGPWIKERLKKVEQAVLLGHVKNDVNSIKEWLYS
ncbi:CCA tRNA nucleotidyltransferase [Caldibacillus lycopersici]|uniref:CCA-adding enzyme n=1 Tax=Perspicuibacillus lycopersici TaxID=1325689 RepID=A0AAE3LQN0_9BACI|nr:CCA tRNA nucleotidyltransferase [Perspicuibacillus lycopersici]MCU9613689.1 CCA tRNA nucleotidyltransferase [Perspicuibacillus lycopersici]